MASIKYIVLDGIPPFVASITPSVQPNQNLPALGNYFFANLNDGVYTIRVTDGLGCWDEITVTVNCDTTTTTTTCIVEASLNQIACEDWEEGCVGCYEYLLQNTSGTESAEFHIITCAGVSTNVTIYPDSQLELCLQACMVYSLDGNGIATRTEDCTPSTTTSTTIEPTTTTSTTSEPTTTTTSTTIEPTSTTTTSTTLGPETEYGFLYNGYAAMGDSNGDGSSDKNIANTGWRVPIKSDFSTLITNIEPAGSDTSNTVGGYLKETGTTYWLSPNTGATNSVGFNLRGHGRRNGEDGSFINQKERGDIWTTTPYGAQLYIGEAVYNSSLFNNNVVSNLDYGFAIRLVKESTTLSDGETGIYIGNNGKVYPTICIDTQEWLACDLEETEFRDGSPIQYIGNGSSDHAIWAAATSAAYCIYPIT